jgi:hypothetical protein
MKRERSQKQAVSPSDHRYYDLTNGKASKATQNLNQDI